MVLHRCFMVGLLLAVAVLLPAATAAPAATPSTSWLQGWPMMGHDPQRTGRSTVAGPAQLHLLLSHKGISASAIGPDGVIYGCMPAEPWNKSRVVALAPDGHMLWQRRPCMDIVLAPDGTLLTVGWNSPKGASMFSDDDTAAMAYAPNGRRLWKIQPFGQLKGARLLAGADDRFYVPIVGHATPYDGFNVMTPGGRIVRRFNHKFYVSALGQNGTLYGIDIGGDELIALSPRGKERWHASLAGMESGLGRIIVGADGTNFVGTGGAIVAYSASGQRLWEQKSAEAIFNLALRADGVLLAAGERSVWATEPDGTVRWRQPIGRSSEFDDQSLIVDADGTTYVGTADGKVRTFSPTGGLITTLTVSPPRKGAAAQAPGLMLAPNGQLVVSAANGVLQVYG